MDSSESEVQNVWKKISREFLSGKEIVRYPIEKGVTSKDGVYLSGKILAKSPHEIAFQREIDGKNFVIPLARLSDSDVQAVNRLPDGGGNILSELKEKASPPAAGPSDGGRRFGEPGSFLSQMNWHRSFEQAAVAARKSDRPVMMVCTGDSYYSRESGMVSRDEIAVKVSGSFTRTVLNNRQFRSFAGENSEPLHFYFSSHDNGKKGIKGTVEDRKRWRIEKLPLVLLIHPERGEMARIEGYDSKGPTPYLERLRGILSN